MKIIKFNFYGPVCCYPPPNKILFALSSLWRPF